MQASSRNTPALDVLACPECLGTLTDTKSSDLCCRGCGQVFRSHDGCTHFSEIQDDVIPDLNEGYVKNRGAWSPWRKKNYEFFSREMSTSRAGSTVIDIGAGPGFFADLFENHCYHALDFFPYPGVGIVTDIVTKRLPIQSEIADVVILSNVLEHVSKPEHVLSESFRVLKPEGRILVTVPFLIKLHQEPYDFCRYTHHKLMELLGDVGFQNVSCRKLGSILDVLGGLKWEIQRIARKNTKHPWLLKQILRVDYHLNNIFQKVFLGAAGIDAASEDFFVGYACVANKASGDFLA